jgi:hypothetical protein
MAQQMTVRFVDDLDGSEAVGTVTFALESRAYEIDLSDENTDKLHEALAPFIEHGRQIGRGSGRGRGRRPACGGEAHPLESRADPRDSGMGSPERAPGERPGTHPEVGYPGVPGCELIHERRRVPRGPAVPAGVGCVVRRPAPSVSAVSSPSLEHPGPARWLARSLRSHGGGAARSGVRREASADVESVREGVGRCPGTGVWKRF